MPGKDAASSTTGATGQPASAGGKGGGTVNRSIYTPSYPSMGIAPSSGGAGRYLGGFAPNYAQTEPQALLPGTPYAPGTPLLTPPVTPYTASPVAPRPFQPLPPEPTPPPPTTIAEPWSTTNSPYGPGYEWNPITSRWTSTNFA